MKVLAFGDSFVKMFLHCQPQVKHFKFKGKSVRGLIKEEDAQRRRVQKQIRKAPNGTQILLIFGQVDFNYIRYFKIIQGQPPITQQTFKKYVQWVASMNFKKNISIVSIFPTPIKKQRVVNSLINKGSYLPQQQTPEIDEKILAQFDRSQQTWYLWNSWIENHCKKNKVKNLRLFEKNYLQPEFYDLSQLTIHLRYVPVLKLIKKYIDIKFDAQKAESIEKQYQIQKADRIANSITRMQSVRSDTFNELSQKQKNQKSSQNDIGLKMSKNQQQISQNIQCKSQQLQKQQQIVIQNKRKQTADLDTDTNIQKQSEKSKQIQSNLERQTQNQFQILLVQQKQDKVQRQRQQQKEIINNARSSSNQPIQETKKSKKKQNKKSKTTKQKQKEKKKYICVDRKQKQECQDEGQMFFKLSMNNRRK